MWSLLQRNRDFRRVFFAQIVSFCGDWFCNVALLGLVLDATGSDLAASLVFVSSTLPQFLVTPLAGPAADRFDRRKLMVAVSLAQIAAALTLLLAGSSTVWIAFIAQAAISALGAFFAPASSAALPNLVEPEDLATATTMMSATWGAMLAVGAGIGGLFTAAFGREASFVADAVSFALAAGLIASVRRPMRSADHVAPTDRMRPLKESAEGLRYARTQPTVMALLASKMGFGLSGGVVGLLAVWSKSEFHAGDGGTGLLLAARGIGVVAGPFVARRIIRGEGVPTIFRACGLAAIGYGLGYAVIPFSPWILAASAAVLFAHLGGGAQWTLSTYGLQLVVPDQLRGRIGAFDYALVTLTLTISFTLAGWASNAWGPGPPTLVLAAVSGAWGVAYLALTRRIHAENAAAAALA